MSKRWVMLRVRAETRDALRAIQCRITENKAVYQRRGSTQKRPPTTVDEAIIALLNVVRHHQLM